MTSPAAGDEGRTADDSRHPVVDLDLGRLDVNPHPALAECRRVGRVVWVPALTGWLVTGFAAAVEILTDAETFTVDDPRFSTARLTGPSMLTLDGREQRRHRQAFAATYRPKNVAALADRLRARADELVRGREGAVLDVGADLARPLAIDALIAVLDLSDPAADVLTDWHRQLVAGFAEDHPGQGLLPVVREMRARLGTRAEGPGKGLDEAQYAANLAIMLIGGIETVEGMTAFAARYRFGDAVGRSAPRDAVIEESLRLEPSAAHLDRYATTDRTIGEVEIRAGDFVVVSISGAHRDPAEFDRPDEFDPGRWTAGTRPRHLGFADGPHFCLGAHLARLETSVALGAIEESRPHARLDPTVPAADAGAIFRRPERLVLI